MHCDQPINNGDNLTFSASYVKVFHSANGITWTDLSAGDDGSLISVKSGYYFGNKVWLGNLQPYAQVQDICSDESGEGDTLIYGFGLNYFIKGAANKLTLEATFVDQDEEIKNLKENHTIITFQFACGF